MRKNNFIGIIFLLSTLQIGCKNYEVANQHPEQIKIGSFSRIDIGSKATEMLAKVDGTSEVYLRDIGRLIVDKFSKYTKTVLINEVEIESLLLSSAKFNNDWLRGIGNGETNTDLYGDGNFKIVEGSPKKSISKANCAFSYSFNNKKELDILVSPETIIKTIGQIYPTYLYYFNNLKDTTRKKIINSIEAKIKSEASLKILKQKTQDSFPKELAKDSMNVNIEMAIEKRDLLLQLIYKPDSNETTIFGQKKDSNDKSKQFKAQEILGETITIGT
jgi:hypothetical protein